MNYGSLILLIPAIMTVAVAALWLYALLSNKKLLRILAWIQVVLGFLYGFIQIILIVIVSTQV